MRRAVLTFVVLVAAGVTGCGDAPPPPTPATDPDTIKKLQEEQKQGSKGEKRG